MNKVLLTGRLTKDPELKHTNTGIAVVQFTLAVNRTYASRSGEKQADFISCVVWRYAAENLAKYIRKGGLIAVEGEIQTRNYEDNNGVKHYVTEVVCSNVEFLESKPSGQRTQGFDGFNDVNQFNVPSYQESRTPANEDPFKDIQSNFDITNDDLPF